MPSILRALPWASAMLFVAGTDRFGLIGEAQAATLVAIFPALMIATMKARPCALRQRNV